MTATVQQQLTEKDRTAQADSGKHKAQTEPIAALVSISAVCLALSVYAGVHTNVLSILGSDHEIESGTGDRVWKEISDDGVMYADHVDVSDRTLPAGYYASINITYVAESGRAVTLDERTYGPAGSELSTDVTPPRDAGVYERTISLQLHPGDIRPATLTVVVWQ